MDTQVKVYRDVSVHIYCVSSHLKSMHLGFWVPFSLPHGIVINSSSWWDDLFLLIGVVNVDLFACSSAFSMICVVLSYGIVI